MMTHISDNCLTDIVRWGTMFLTTAERMFRSPTGSARRAQHHTPPLVLVADKRLVLPPPLDQALRLFRRSLAPFSPLGEGAGVAACPVGNNGDDDEGSKEQEKGQGNGAADDPG